MLEKEYTQQQLEARLREARRAASYKAWLDLMSKFTDKQRHHVANLMAHGWEVAQINLTRKKPDGIERVKATARSGGAEH